MNVRIDRIPPSGRTFELEIDQERLDRELGQRDPRGTRWIAPATSTVRLMVGQGSLDIEGRVRFEHRQPCTRCLAEVQREEAPEFRLTKLLAPPPRGTTVPVELDAETIDEDYHAGEEIDLTEVVLEQIALETPLAVLCKEECRGLCPRCGIDLNEQSCSCDTAPVDPRFAVLAQLSIESKPEPDTND